MKKNIYFRNCPICGIEFSSSQITAKTCSKKCRQALYIANLIVGKNEELAIKTGVRTTVLTPVGAPVRRDENSLLTKSLISNETDNQVVVVVDVPKEETKKGENGFFSIESFIEIF